MDPKKKERAKAGLLALKALNLEEIENIENALDALDEGDQAAASMYLDLCGEFDRTGFRSVIDADDKSVN